MRKNRLNRREHKKFKVCKKERVAQKIFLPKAIFPKKVILKSKG